jgi:hypothetical protein
VVDFIFYHQYAELLLMMRDRLLEICRRGKMNFIDRMIASHGMSRGGASSIIRMTARSVTRPRALFALKKSDESSQTLFATSICSNTHHPGAAYASISSFSFQLIDSLISVGVVISPLIKCNHYLSVDDHRF